MLWTLLFLLCGAIILFIYSLDIKIDFITTKERIIVILYYSVIENGIINRKFITLYDKARNRK